MKSYLLTSLKNHELSVIKFAQLHYHFSLFFLYKTELTRKNGSNWPETIILRHLKRFSNNHSLDVKRLLISNMQKYKYLFKYMTLPYNFFLLVNFLSLSFSLSPPFSLSPSLFPSLFPLSFCASVGPTCECEVKDREESLDLARGWSLPLLFLAVLYLYYDAALSRRGTNTRISPRDDFVMDRISPGSPFSRLALTQKNV